MASKSVKFKRPRAKWREIRGLRSQLEHERAMHHKLAGELLGYMARAMAGERAPPVSRSRGAGMGRVRCWSFHEWMLVEPEQFAEKAKDETLPDKLKYCERCRGIHHGPGAAPNAGRVVSGEIQYHGENRPFHD